MIPETVSIALARTARLWIRYAPLPLFKEWMWQRASWRSHDYRARTRHGTWMRGRSTDLVQGFIYYFGHWEPNLTAWLLRRLAGMDGRVFVDVGANVGYYTVLAASRMTTSCSVVAVEASPRIHRLLLDNIALNGLTNVRAVCCAALASEGSVKLYHGDSNNLGGTTTTEDIAQDRQGVTVPGRRLCDIVGAAELPRVRLVKIDVEGAEWSVMQGLIPMFERLPDDAEFVIEVVPGLMNADDVDRLFDFMEGRGFNAYRIENCYDAHSYLRPGRLERPWRLSERPTEGGDVVFSRIDASKL